MSDYRPDEDAPVKRRRAKRSATAPFNPEKSIREWEQFGERSRRGEAARQKIIARRNDQRAARGLDPSTK